MVNINKQIKDFNISANLGWSYSNYWALERGYKGTLLKVPNKFAVSNIDPSTAVLQKKAVTAVSVTMLFSATSNWDGRVCFT